jgi:hypothetical protein
MSYEKQIYDVEISEELLEKIKKLDTALDNFHPRTRYQRFKLWPSKQHCEVEENSPREALDILCRQVKWLMRMVNEGSLNDKYRAVYSAIIDATSDRYWLLTELRDRADESARILRGILISMQSNLIDHKHFKLIPLTQSRPGQTQDHEIILHELLMQLKAVNS